MRTEVSNYQTMNKERELVPMAVERGIAQSKNAAKKLPKDELCRLLRQRDLIEARREVEVEKPAQKAAQEPAKLPILNSWQTRVDKAELRENRRRRRINNKRKRKQQLARARGAGRVRVGRVG